MRKILFVLICGLFLIFMGCASSKKSGSIYHSDGLIGKSNNKNAYHTIYYCGNATSVKKTYWYKPGTWKVFNK